MNTTDQPTTPPAGQNGAFPLLSGMKSREQRKDIYAALRMMPPLRFRSDASKEFVSQESEVLRYIVSLFQNHLPAALQLDQMGQFKEANRIWNCAKQATPHAVLKVDEPSTWAGVDFVLNVFRKALGTSTNA